MAWRFQAVDATLISTQAEAEAAAKAAAEKERLAQEASDEADRIAAEKAEAERIAQEKADAEAKEKEEADRIAAEKAEAERLLKEQAEAEAKKSDEADRLAAAAAKASDDADKAQKEAEEKAEEAEEAVEQEGDGEGVLPTARTIGLGAVEQLGGVQRSVQHRARSPQPAPTSPYAGAEAYTLAYSGAPPSQILAGAPPPLPPPVRNCVEINQCVGCTRQFFTKSFLGDDAANLARSSGEEPVSPRHRAGVASMAWRTMR